MAARVIPCADSLTDNWSYFLYKPTPGVPATFAALFLISGVLHLYQNNLRRKSPRIGFLLPWSAAIFTAGFICREIACHDHNYQNLSLFIATQVLVFAGPPVYQGADYFIMGRVLYYIPYHSPIHPGRVISTFIGLDVIIEALTGNGAAYAFNHSLPHSKQIMGLDMIRATLVLQVVLFLTFLLLILYFHRQCQRTRVFARNLRVVVYTLYGSCFLILFRNTFRCAASFYSLDATANRSEALFYAIEVLPMLSNSVLLNIFPPAKYLPSSNKIYLARDGKTELEGPGWTDKRHFLLKLFDPLDFVGLFTGRDKKTRFWEDDGIAPPEEPNAKGRKTIEEV
ncbi:MAG: hypothetical protein Q9227_006507 [Pyrenula ochraceoflavens]